MKKLILIVSLICAVALPSRAGLQPDVTLNGGTNKCLAVTTNSYHAGVFDITKNHDTGISITYGLDGAGATTTNAFSFDSSMDNARWNTNAITIQTFTVGTNMTTTVVTTNLGGIFFLRLGQSANTNATLNMTNMTVIVGTKNGL